MQSDQQVGNSVGSSPAAKGKHAGAVRVLFQKIIEARVAKGWSKKTLSKMAPCSLATVKNIENGHDAFPSTIEKLGRQLGLTLSDLTIGLEPVIASNHEIKLHKKVLVKIFYKADYDKFDETLLHQEIERIRSDHQIEGEIIVVQIEDGSVIVTLEMDEGTAKVLIQILAAQNDSRLPVISSMGIRRANIKEDLELYTETTDQIYDLTKSESGRFRYSSLDKDGFHRIWKHYPFKDKITIHIILFISHFIGDSRAFRQYGLIYNSLVFIQTTFWMLRWANVMFAGLSPAFLVQEYANWLQTQPSLGEGETQIDWWLAWRIWGVVISNVISISTVNSIRDTLLKTFVIASFSVNVFSMIIYFIV